MKLFSRSALAAVILSLAASGVTSAADDKSETLATAVKSAIAAKDAAALEKLVYWEGATEGGRTFFKALLANALDTKVETVTVEPLPAGKTGPPTTLTVTHLLKITGRAGDDGSGGMRQMFPVGEKDGKLYLAAAKDTPAGLPK